MRLRDAPLTAVNRAWTAWILASVLVAILAGFLAVGLFGSAQGATLCFCGGALWWAESPRAVRWLGRRYAA